VCVWTGLLFRVYLYLTQTNVALLCVWTGLLFRVYLHLTQTNVAVLAWMSVVLGGEIFAIMCWMPAYPKDHPHFGCPPFGCHPHGWVRIELMTSYGRK
jgi:hypothetical protein